MNTSDQLIADYQQRVELAQQSKEADAALVKKHLVAAYEKNLPVWFGEFAKELVVDLTAPGSFDYHPNSQDKDDAEIIVNFTWRSIKGKIILTAVSPGHRGRSRSIGSFVLYFNTEHSFNETLYSCDASLNLPVSPAAQDSWYYPEAKGEVNAEELAELLIKFVKIKEERDLSLMFNEARHLNNRYDHFRSYLIHYSRTVELLTANFDKAMTSFPEGAKKWQELKLAKMAAFEKEREAAAAHAELVRTYTVWIYGWKRVLEANQKKLAGVQRAYSYSFPVFELTYGIAAEEDGDRYASTAMEFVSQDKPDRKGWFISLEREKHPVKFMHPVKIETKIVDVKSAHTSVVRSLYVPGCLMHIKYPGICDVQEIEAALEKEAFERLPTDIREDIEGSGSRVAWYEAVRGVVNDDERAFNALCRLVEGIQEPDDTDF